MRQAEHPAPPAPPVLVKIKDVGQAKLVLSQATQLSKMRRTKKVFITPDMDEKEREKSRELKNILKKHSDIRRADVVL